MDNATSSEKWRRYVLLIARMGVTWVQLCRGLGENIPSVFLLFDLSKHVLISYDLNC